MGEADFSTLPDDVILSIFLKLDGDPRMWACLACVCTKFSSLIRNFCCRRKCLGAIPWLLSETSPPGGWASLCKVAVCCPGLHHAGVPPENSDPGLGPSENHDGLISTKACPEIRSILLCTNSDLRVSVSVPHWSLFDDLNCGIAYESRDGSEPRFSEESEKNVINVDCEFSSCKKRKICRSMNSHVASRIWNLSREEGGKLLARQFRDDYLYISDWPGCLHVENKRNYMLFRGVFRDFKQSRVWKTINDSNREKINLGCAYCQCNETWDLRLAFCLRRIFGYHDDGEPVVRAYVCENGHVSGAWTDWPLYT